MYYTASGIITTVGGRPVHRLREDGVFHSKLQRPGLCVLMKTTAIPCISVTYRTQLQYPVSQLLTKVFNTKFLRSVGCNIVLPMGAFADVRNSNFRNTK